MSSPSNAIPEPGAESQATGTVAIPATQQMYWSVRRELWEYKSIYLAPLAIAALIVIGFLFSSIAGVLQRALSLNPEQAPDKIVEPYTFAALLIMGTTFIVALFYCVEALHGERRDRSILFWKSLPVSDLTTVLSKMTIPVVVLPLVTFAVTVATHCAMLLFGTAALASRGVNVGAAWSRVPQMWPILLYHLVALHGLWYAPIYAWLLLVSGWARRLAFLWAALPLIGIGVFEKIAFNSSHFANLIMNRVGGGDNSPVVSTPGSMSIESMTHPSPSHFLISPGLWIGLLVAAGLLAAAVQVRRSRGPI